VRSGATKSARLRILEILVLAFILLGLGTGCASLVKKTEKLPIPPAYQQAKTATLDELVALINERYAGIESLVAAKFEVEFQGGSAELGFVEKYPKAKGYLAVKLPASVYVNILNPLTSSTVVAMASHGDSFEIWAPRENKYLVGQTNVPLDEKRPMFNVRPNHLLNALLIEKLPADGPLCAVFLEEEQDASAKYYILNVITRPAPDARFCLTRRAWIERSGMRLTRQQYYDCGAPVSVIEYGRPIEQAGFLVNTEVDVERIREHYRMDLQMAPESLEVNRAIKDERFSIPKPPGAELVVIGEEGASSLQ
jgi:hypothetical protein